MVKLKCRQRQTLVRKLYYQSKSEKGQERTQKPQNFLTVELRGANAEGHTAADQKHSEGLPTLSLCSDISYQSCSPCLARLQGSKGRMLPPPTATPAAPILETTPSFTWELYPWDRVSRGAVQVSYALPTCCFCQGKEPQRGVLVQEPQKCGLTKHSACSASVSQGQS